MQKIEYRDQDVLLEAYCSHFAKSGEKKPAVLVFHAWAGRDEIACQKAEALAALGYVGIAVDLYGKGVVGRSKEENRSLMGPLVEDRAILRQRILSAWDMAINLPFVDKEKMGAIGFCFGGLCALDLARSGAPVKGVVSFHGLLEAPESLKSEKIQSRILVLHGHDDPMATPDVVQVFEDEMTAAQVDWQVHIYSGTMHAFTNPLAHDPAFGTVYQPQADFRSWKAMKNFFEETFG